MKGKSNKILIWLTTIFGTAMVVFFALFLSFWATSSTYKTQLENSYMKSFYEMVDNVNTLEVNLSKIVATNSVDSQRELLTNVYENCKSGVEHVNMLPINNDKLTELNKLLNKTGGFAYSLLLENYNDKLISDEDFEQVEGIYSSVRELQ